MMFRPERCIVVVVATAILHNICIVRRLPLPDDDERVDADEGDDSDKDDDNDADDVHRQNNRNDGVVTKDDLIRTAFQ